MYSKFTMPVPPSYPGSSFPLTSGRKRRSRSFRQAMRSKERRFEVRDCANSRYMSSVHARPQKQQEVQCRISVVAVKGDYTSLIGSRASQQMNLVTVQQDSIHH